MDPAEKWKTSWQREQGDPKFHAYEVHPCLRSNIQLLLQAQTQPENSKQHRVLVPLSGKTLDLAYIASMANVSEVVGVEAVRIAVEEYKAENPQLQMHWDNTTTTQSTEEQGVDLCIGQHESTRARIKQYVCDFFQCTPRLLQGAFDACWDRGSLVAVDPELRKAYVDTVDALMHANARYLLTVFNRVSGSDNALKQGPPYTVVESDVQTLYQPKGWSVKKLSSEDITDQPIQAGTDHTKWRDLELTCMLQETYLLTKDT